MGMRDNFDEHFNCTNCDKEGHYEYDLCEHWGHWDLCKKCCEINSGK